MACMMSGDGQRDQVAQGAQHHAHDHARPAAGAACAARRAPAQREQHGAHRAHKGRPSAQRGQPLRRQRATRQTAPGPGHAQRCARGAAQQNGSASGLRNSPCATAPARPSSAPASQAPRVRGRRMSHTICQATGSSACAARCQNPCCPRWRHTRPAQRGQQRQQHQPARRRGFGGAGGRGSPGAGTASRRGWRAVHPWTLSWGVPPGHRGGGLGGPSCQAAAISRAASAMRGPGRTTMSESPGQTRTPAARAPRACGPARVRHQACMLRLPIMMRSGLARTTNSGFSLGNGPSDAGTMLRTPSRASVSPMNDASPAA
jgi:hypothetical protein